MQGGEVLRHGVSQDPGAAERLGWQGLWRARWGCLGDPAPGQGAHHFSLPCWVVPPTTAHY